MLHCCYVSHLQLYKKFKVAAPAEYTGRGKEWNIDLIPKFFLANGESLGLFIIIFLNLKNILLARFLVEMNHYVCSLLCVYIR